MWINLVLRILDLVRNVMHFDAQLVRPLRHLQGFRFRIEGLELRGWGLGFRVQGLGFRFSDFGFRISGFAFRS